jgi:hypothetical protein
MPELLQEAFTEEAVSERLLPLLTDADANASARRALIDTTSRLRSSGDPIAEVVRQVLWLQTDVAS